MGKRAVLLLTLVGATLLAFGGSVLAQPTEQRTTPEKGAQTSNSRVKADDTDNRGSPQLKQPVKQPSDEESVSGQQATSPIGAQEATTQASEPKANGAWIEDVWLDPKTKIPQFTNTVGTQPRIIMYFQNWEQLDKKYFDPVKMQAAVNNGATPMVTWAPRDPTKGVNQSKYALKTIIAGNHDAYIRQWARDAASWGKPMYLRFAHEMNGTWFPWSPGVNGNTAKQFRDSWTRVHRIFQQEGATNVRWVWSPHVNCGSCSSFGSVYPGNAYVNWVALDGYNWGTSRPGFSWQTASQVFGPSYDQITTQVAPSKPFMIAETSSAEAGGNKAQWITDTFTKDIPNRLPLTRAVVWFSDDKTDQGETNWRVDSTPEALKAYQDAAKLDSYQGQLP